MAQPESEIARQVIQEHEALNRNIAELKRLISGQFSFKDFFPWRAEFIGRLQDLRKKLSLHFEFEEQGGFMKEVTDYAPRFFDKVNELEIEHKAILCNLDSLMVDLRKLDRKDEPVLQDIFNRLSNLVNLLHDHEMTESELMQRAFFREHGAPH